MWTEEWIEAFWVSKGQFNLELNQREASHGFHIFRTCRNYFHITIFSLISFLLINKQPKWRISSCVLCWNWFTYIRKCLCKSTYKAKMDQEVSEASGMLQILLDPFLLCRYFCTNTFSYFTTEVRSWKLLTIDIEGFVLNVMWSLDSPLNKYLRFWNFL